MTPGAVEQRLRLFLLVVSGFIFAGTILELVFTEHTESTLQLLPFGLCVVGFSAVVMARYVPRKPVLLGLRVIMVGIVLASLFGIYEHVAHNLAFELEIRPNATMRDVFWDALLGASPPFAPGILALAALLALAATYQHPALGGSNLAEGGV